MKKILFILTLLLPWIGMAQNVTNARFEQAGKTVRIYYDLSEPADVSIYLSTDGGSSYESTPLKTVSGDVGKKVAAGTNRCAVWDVLSDRDKLQGSDICFKVTASKGGAQTFTVKGITFKMVSVEGGTFTMGATSEQGSVDSDEHPAHQVTLSSYSIGETEVTQALWKAVMGETVSQIASRKGWNTYGVGDNYPMYYISWEDCQTFIRKLNTLTGKRFRLPTEAEWEYAARGGSKSRGYKYAGGNTLEDVGWNWNNSGDRRTTGDWDDFEQVESNNCRTHQVAQKRPNELGLYDMSGNVWEWCSDWYGDYSSYAQTNPTGAKSGSYRVCRGGSWINIARHCRVSFRDYGTPSDRDVNLGFRLALSE